MGVESKFAKATCVICAKCRLLWVDSREGYSDWTEQRRG
jgi:hypothetical protein